MVDQEILDIIKGAIVILETEGWAQRTPFYKDGRYTTLGAIGKASGYVDYAKGFKDSNVPERKDIAFATVAYIGKELSTSYVDTVWNDHPLQTKENVISTLTALGEGLDIQQLGLRTHNGSSEKP